MAGELAVLGAFLLACLAAAVSGAVFRPGPWYDRLDKPSWTPPDWLFPVAWTLLYIAIGVAPWLVWRELGLAAAALPLGVWAAQLVLNAAWSWLFFGLNRIGWALAEMALLIGLVVLCTRAFGNVTRPAGWLMAPYLAWLAFAFALNFSIWALNGEGFGNLIG